MSASADVLREESRRAQLILRELVPRHPAIRSDQLLLRRGDQTVEGWRRVLHAAPHIQRHSERHAEEAVAASAVKLINNDSGDPGGNVNPMRERGDLPIEEGLAEHSSTVG